MIFFVILMIYTEIQHFQIFFMFNSLTFLAIFSYSNLPNNRAVEINVQGGHFSKKIINVQVHAGLINVH